MRSKNDYTYAEWKALSENAYTMRRDNWTADECRSMLADQENEFIVGSSVFLFVMAVVCEEIKWYRLEDKVLDVAAYHIYRFENMGRYRDDLTPEEIAEIEKDIAYIKSKVNLPELESYDDSLMENDSQST